MLVQNIIFIPVLFALAISGIRLYKSVMKDKARENIKLEMLRHTIFSAMLTVCLIVASFLETYVSTNIFMFTLNIL
ncbi:MAG: stage II sporulation protein M [Clostridia bacterium]|nr:stage II sporulation protein M [Clostridia bacterium]